MQREVGEEGKVGEGEGKIDLIINLIKQFALMRAIGKWMKVYLSLSHKH